VDAVLVPQKGGPAGVGVALWGAVPPAGGGSQACLLLLSPVGLGAPGGQGCGTAIFPGCTRSLVLTK
jgi:hypothetical protein